MCICKIGYYVKIKLKSLNTYHYGNEYTYRVDFIGVNNDIYC